jgi:hypothetical protein
LSLFSGDTDEKLSLLILDAEPGVVNADEGNERRLKGVYGVERELSGVAGERGWCLRGRRCGVTGDTGKRWDFRERVVVGETTGEYAGVDGTENEYLWLVVVIVDMQTVRIIPYNRV